MTLHTGHRVLVFDTCSSPGHIAAELVAWCWSALGISPPPPQLSLIQRDRLEALQERVAVPYDAGSPTHQVGCECHGGPASASSCMC